MGRPTIAESLRRQSLGQHEVLVEQIIPAVQASAESVMGTTNSPVNHNDVEQTVYAKISHRDTMPTPMYARRAAYTTALDIRELEARSVPIGDRTHPVFSHSVPSVEETVTRRQDMLTTIKELPPKQQRVVTLRYLLDMSTNDTAEVLGISVSDVKASLMKGIATLREIMKPEDF